MPGPADAAGWFILSAPSPRMHHSLLYAKALSVLLEEVQSAAGEAVLRSGLLRVRRFARAHALTLTMTDAGLQVDGAPVPRSTASVQRLSDAMLLHGVARIVMRSGAVARELFQMVLLLARPTRTTSAGSTLFDEVRELSLWDVQLYPVRPANDRRRSKTHAADVRLSIPGQINVRATALVQSVKLATAARDSVAVTDALSALLDIEQDVQDLGLRALWTLAFDTAATDDALRVLAAGLPTCGDARPSVVAILKRAGDRGAHPVLDQLLAADTLDARRACFDALIEIRRGVTRLLKLLDHEQWFVARNAACLLGEIGQRSTEPELTMKLTHPDSRVRAAVVTALLRLNSPSACAAVRTAIRDESADVRRRAVRGFLADDGVTNNVTTLLQALEREDDLDVQTEFVHALGALATPEAVQKLIRLCSGAGTANRPPDFRIAAAEALTTARMSAAIPFLRGMMKDPDVTARTAARHLLRAVS